MHDSKTGLWVWDLHVGVNYIRCMHPTHRDHLSIIHLISSMYVAHIFFDVPSHLPVGRIVKANSKDDKIKIFTSIRFVCLASFFRKPCICIQRKFGIIGRIT